MPLISADLSNGQYYDEPFSHYVASNALQFNASIELLQWLRVDAPWTLIETTFYEQYEFSFLDVELPASIASLVGHESIAKVKSLVEGKFGVKLSKEFDFTAHKLVRDQRIRIHNDYIPGRETHRVLIQLNEDWTDSNGGLLLFFSGNDPSDLAKVFRPAHNSCVAFAISPQSQHAVSTIHGGERFTLVYSFYQDYAKCDLK